jgi:hypothetical protein
VYQTAGVGLSFGQIAAALLSAAIIGLTDNRPFSILRWPALPDRWLNKGNTNGVLRVGDNFGHDESCQQPCRDVDRLPRWQRAWPTSRHDWPSRSLATHIAATTHAVVLIDRRRELLEVVSAEVDFDYVLAPRIREVWPTTD